MIPEIEAVVEAYRELYRSERPCGCTAEHQYPYNVDENGMPAVCLAHEWDRQHRLLSELLVSRRLSMPVPEKVRGNGRAQETMAMLGDIVYANPVYMESKPVLNKAGDDGSLATWLASYLSKLHWDDACVAKRQHIVAYLDRSFIITNTFQKRELEMRDVLTYAPVLVYWDNHDRRNGSWILNTIRSRQYGLALVVK